MGLGRVCAPRRGCATRWTSSSAPPLVRARTSSRSERPRCRCRGPTCTRVRAGLVRGARRGRLRGSPRADVPPRAGAADAAAAAPTDGVDPPRGAAACTSPRSSWRALRPPQGRSPCRSGLSVVRRPVLARPATSARAPPRSCDPGHRPPRAEAARCRDHPSVAPLDQRVLLLLARALVAAAARVPSATWGPRTAARAPLSWLSCAYIWQITQQGTSRTCSDDHRAPISCSCCESRARICLRIAMTYLRYTSPTASSVTRWGADPEGIDRRRGPYAPRSLELPHKTLGHPIHLHSDQVYLQLAFHCRADWRLTTRRLQLGDPHTGIRASTAKQNVCPLESG